jgi:hypothetical protein
MEKPSLKGKYRSLKAFGRLLLTVSTNSFGVQHLYSLSILS